MGRPSTWVWRALVGGVILGLPAGALLFVQVPILAVIDVKADRRLLAAQVRAGESFVLSYRHPVTRGLVSVTFEVESDGSLSVKEATPQREEYEIAGGVIRQESRGERLPELSVLVYPSTDHALVVKGQTLSLSREVRPGSLVRIRVERRFWWQQAFQKWWRRLGGEGR